VPNLSFLRKRQKTYRDFSEVSAGAAKAFFNQAEPTGEFRCYSAQNVSKLKLLGVDRPRTWHV